MKIKYLLTVLVPVLFLQFNYGQTSVDSSFFDDDYVEADTYFGVFYENKILKNNFYNQVNSFNRYSYSNPIHVIGFSAGTAFNAGARMKINFFLEYGYQIAQDVLINDTTVAKLSGYSLNLGLFGIDLFPKSTIFDFNVGMAIRVGRMRLKADEYRATQNGYFGPSFYVNPKFTIAQKVQIGLKFDYFFDLSSARWKNPIFYKKSLERLEVDNLKQSAFIPSLSISYAF